MTEYEYLKENIGTLTKKEIAQWLLEYPLARREIYEKHCLLRCPIRRPNLSCPLEEGQICPDYDLSVLEIVERFLDAAHIGTDEDDLDTGEIPDEEARLAMYCHGGPLDFMEE